MNILRLLCAGLALAFVTGCATDEMPPGVGPATPPLTDPDQAAPITGSGVFDVNQ